MKVPGEVDDVVAVGLEGRHRLLEQKNLFHTIGLQGGELDHQRERAGHLGVDDQRDTALHVLLSTNHHHHPSSSGGRHLKKKDK